MKAILRRILFDNIPLKVLALGLALALFFLVRGQKIDLAVVREPTPQTIDGVPVTVRAPLGLSGHNQWVVEPNQVVLVLRGERKVVQTLDRGRFAAYVTWNTGSGRGPQKLPVLVDGVPSGVSLEIHPAEVLVSRPTPSGE